MESSPEEVAVASYSSSSTGTIGDGYAAAGFTKRKRTKRLRAFPSPPPLPPGNNIIIDEDSYDGIAATTTEEEEDMANCLILLAQGRTDHHQSPREEKFTSRKFTETVTTAGARAGFYVYECKTCNKCFPSFQALGGHRASHKKPKLAVGPANSIATGRIKDHNGTDGGDGLEIRMNSTFACRSSPAAGNRLRVHECSVCGSEFASGQALGGHMRRHRPVGPAAAAAVVAPASEEKKGSNSMLSLDLNLPAPTEENMAPFAFIDQRPMALVDCHY